MVVNLEDNTLHIALRESADAFHKAAQADISRAGSPPPMIAAMNQGLDRYPQLDAALKAGVESDGAQQFRHALTLYAGKIDAHYETYGEYPAELKLPAPKNDAERYVWLLTEAFLQTKIGKKPRLQEV